MDNCKLLSLIIIIFICAIPLEKGNMMKNEVTPAPPTDLSELFGQKEESYDLISPIKVVTADNIEPSNEKNDKKTVEETNKEEQDSVKIINKSKLMISQPICRYNISEIFFGTSVTPIEAQPSVEVTTVPNIVETEEIAKLADQGETVKNVPADEKSIVHDTNMTDHPTKKTDDNEEDMKLEVDNMHSFEEWKNLKLQEQESNKAYEEPSQVHNIRAKKTQVNYASQDCGAKVLAHNEEAKHTSAILDENRDLYMLNPCSTNIWFVIELCEPIQVEQLQLGNLELFSSAPKEFTVSVSERYPAREWHTVGTFHATNERILQTFIPEVKGQMFAKYIKFDMSSHFSNEHFCPLTLVRVLGVSMVDEFDDAEHTVSKEDIQDTGLKENSQASEENSGPINTVFNMVKTAVDHVLNNAAESETNDQIKSNNSEKHTDANDTDNIDPSVESEVVLVTNDTEIAAPKDNGTQSFITLIETGNGKEISDYIKNNIQTCAARKIPLYVPKFIRYMAPITQKLNANVCWFLEFFCKVSLTSCLIHYPYNYSAIGLFVPLSGLGKYFSVEQNSSSDPTETDKGHDNITISPPETSKENIEPNVDIKSNTVEDGKYEDISISNPENIKNNNNPTEVDDKTTGDTKTQNGVVLLSDSSKKNQDALDNNEKHNNLDSVSDDENIKNKNDEIAETQQTILNPEPIDRVNRPEVDTVVEVPTQGRDHTPANIVDTAVNHNIVNTKQPIEDVQISSENSTALNKATNVVDNKTKSAIQNASNINQSVQHPVVINPGTNQKDSVFMRLSNRIRILEQNMSLSSAYLETLSRSYKKQMDEMQRAFNQTTSKLLSTGRTANENDARQTELIHQAQEEIKMLTQQLRNLSVTHDQLNMQLVERHVCLIILEIMVFVAVLVTCLGRKISRLSEDVQRAEDMIEDLQHLIADIRHGRNHTSVKPNGHCASVAFQSSDDRPPPSAAPITQVSKNQNIHHKGHVNSNKEMRRKNRTKIIMNHDAARPNKQTHRASAALAYVEDLGSKVEVAANSRKKMGTWDTPPNPIGLKIPNGHTKGRK
uniref:SUN domain-containing ossification factor-like n=1 Tax=Styela clava TaxID=7725 RepID=UPI00193A1454|nr:SUN domain-containing ossification factor-like [Styela clava]